MIDETLYSKMTSELWSALEELYPTGRGHNYLKFGSAPPIWETFEKLKDMGLTHWSEDRKTGAQENYWLSDQGRELLEEYRRRNGKSSNE